MTTVVMVHSCKLLIIKMRRLSHNEQHAFLSKQTSIFYSAWENVHEMHAAESSIRSLSYI